MVRANGQRDGVGRTRDWASAFEHSRPILDSTRVSPYGPAAREMPQSMRPDTRQHLTACSEPSEETSSPETGVNALRRTEDLRVVRGHLPRARSPAAVKPLRGSCAPLRPVRVTAATDRAGSLAGPANKLAPRSTEAGPGPRVPLRCRGEPVQQTRRRRTRKRRKDLHFRRRPHRPSPGTKTGNRAARRRFRGAGAFSAASTSLSASRSAWGTPTGAGRRRVAAPHRGSPAPAHRAEPGAVASPSSAPQRSSTRHRQRRLRPTSPAAGRYLSLAAFRERGEAGQRWSRPASVRTSRTRRCAWPAPSARSPRRR